MDSLTEGELAQITRLEREAGVQRLSRHFSWSEFSDERQGFHQEFVYDVTVCAADHGFPWSDVFRSAVIAKCIFPRLEGLEAPELLSLLKDVLLERLPNLTSVQQHEFTQFLADTCVTRGRLFRAVVDGATDVSVAQLHLEVQTPPTPCPLAEGTDLHKWEYQHHQTELNSMLLQKEEKLRLLRSGSRITLGEVDVPEDDQLDKEGFLAVVRAAVKAAEDQILASLTQEASLLSDILQLKLQQAALKARGLQNPVSSSSSQIGSPASSTAGAAKKTGLT